MVFFKLGATHFPLKSNKISTRVFVMKATGTFKLYLGLRAMFHKAANPDLICEPPPFFRTDLFPSYHKYDNNVWEIVKEQLEKQINIHECNGSGWVVTRLFYLDVSFAKNG